jgi:Lrp/AsnC family transcriptional regulator, leucine-responsive regulatory protein
MDKIDISLLEILQEDARITVSELSKKLSLSRPSITERLHRLQEKGVIEGFSARVSPEACGRNTLLFIQISDLKIPAKQWENMIVAEQDVLECHRVTGHIGYVIKAAVNGMDGLRVLVDRLMQYSNYVNTSVILTSPVSYRPILPTKEE